MSRRRSFGSSEFSAANCPYANHEVADPRVGLVKLADAMLVFACGLMVALVVSNNVELSGPEVSEAEITEIDEEDLSSLFDELSDESGSGYEERGLVYEDPTTGQLYLLEPSDSSDDDADENAEEE